MFFSSLSGRDESPAGSSGFPVISLNYGLNTWFYSVAQCEKRDPLSPSANMLHRADLGKLQNTVVKCINVGHPSLCYKKVL